MKWITGFWVCLVLLLACQQLAAQSLSMQWSQAEAGHDGKVYYIKWTTAYEKDCKEYVVEKNIYGDYWQAIAPAIPAYNTKGPNRYHVYDSSGTASVMLYRIRKTDYDGRISYSVTLIAQTGKGVIVQLYSHPASGNLTITAGQPLRVVQLFNTADSLLNVTVMNGINYHTIDSKNLAAGNYYALIQLQDGNIVKEYFIRK